MRIITKGRQRFAAGQAVPHLIEAEIASLSASSITDLRSAWMVRLGTPAPTVRSRDLLLRLFARQVQASILGDLDAATGRRLDEIAAALERDGSYEPKIRRGPAQGAVLTREWRGVVHRVTVTGGGFQHLGRTYKSLSDIARSITGTRRSGPRFFGLEQKSDRRIKL